MRFGGGVSLDAGAGSVAGGGGIGVRVRLAGGSNTSSSNSSSNEARGTGGGSSGHGELAPERVRASLTESLRALRVRRASWLLAQRPDADVPLAIVAGGLSGLVGEGVCEAVS